VAGKTTAPIEAELAIGLDVDATRRIDFSGRSNIPGEFPIEVLVFISAAGRVVHRLAPTHAPMWVLDPDKRRRVLATM